MTTRRLSRCTSGTANPLNRPRKFAFLAFAVIYAWALAAALIGVGYLLGELLVQVTR